MSAPKMKRGPLRRPARLKQETMFGIDVAESAKPLERLTSFAFENLIVHMLFIDGEPWWVAKDACKALSLSNHRQAVHGTKKRRPDGSEYVSGGLQDDEWLRYEIHTGGQSREVLIVNEAGLYRLIFASTKAEAERFKRRVFHEVLPTIRKTGAYAVPGSRQDRINNLVVKLKCDPDVAEARLNLLEQIKELHARMAASGSKRGHFPQVHQAVYRGQFNKYCGDIREILGLSGNKTPLDYLGKIPLADRQRIFAIAERIFIDSGGMNIDGYADLLESLARETTTATLVQMGGRYVLGPIHDPDRGMIFDVVPALPSPTTSPAPAG